jgi:fatty-acid desaturase
MNLAAAPLWSSAATLLSSWTPERGLGVSWLWFALAIVVVMGGTGFGVTVGYHRVLTHRAARLHPGLERTLVFFGLGAGTPVQWIGNHRFHHAHTDTALDPHSPVHRGFWYAHCGWYLQTATYTPSTAVSVLYGLAGPLRTVFDAFWRPRTGLEHVGLAKDIAADGFYGFVSRPGPYAAVLLGYLAVLWGGGVLLFGLPAVVVLWLIHLLAYTFGDLINSAGHLIGARSHQSGDMSRDSAWLAVLAFGDGWHNGHHTFPASIKSGLLPGQVDASYLFVKGCAALSLASDLRVPTAEDIARRRNATTSLASSTLTAETP